MATMGQVYESLGLYAQAQPLVIEALELRRLFLDSANPALIQALLQTASVLKKNNRLVEAEKLLMEAMAAERGRPSPDPLRLADLSEQMSQLLAAMEDYEAADALAYDVLALRRRKLGDQALAVGLGLDNLAQANLPKYREMQFCVRVFEGAIPILKKYYGESHPLLGNIYGQIGHLDKVLGEYNKALAMYGKALTIQRKIYRNEHPALAATLSNMGIIQRLLDRYQDSEANFQEALAIDNRMFGPDSWETAKTMHYLALLRVDQGQYAEAVLLNRQVGIIWQKESGSEDRWFCESLSNLGESLVYNGEYAEAERVLNKAYPIALRLYGPDHLYTINTRRALAHLRLDQGKLDEAVRLLRSCHDFFEKIGAPADERRLVLILLGRGLSLSGKPAEAIKIFDNALADTRKHYGQKHPLVAACLSGMGQARCEMGEYAPAENMLRQALAMQQEFWGPCHPEIAETERALAMLLVKTGRDEAGRALRAEALAMARQVLHPGHPRLKSY